MATPGTDRRSGTIGTTVVPRVLLGVAGLSAVAVAYFGTGWRLAVTQVEDESPVARARREMVQRQLRGRDIRDARVLEVMGRVPRHQFVGKEYQDEAYDDHPLPIGHGQTISQPYIVALMTQLARPKPADRALDIGTGSGYQAAVLAELVQGGLQHRDRQAAGRRGGEATGRPGL